MKRIEQLQRNLRESNIQQVLISDTLSIYYLIQKRFHVQERFIALLVQQSGEPVLFLNHLFPSQPIPGVEMVRFHDSDDYLSLVLKYTSEGVMAVDKSLPARFLLPLMQGNCEIILSSFVEDMRLVKDEEERVKMRNASLVNDEIMGEVEKFLHVGVCDKEVEAFIAQEQAKRGLEPSFGSIVGFRKNAGDPHGCADGQILQESDVCIIDMGMVLEDYCADMTRTFVYNDPKLEEIYQIVLKANLAAEAIIKPGVRFCDIDAAARNVIAEAGYGQYFTHRTGHGIGLEVHEPKDVSSANTDVVQAGYCFSIEPGIYIEGLGGVRIEDLVIVTEDGCEVLNHYRK
ncbi:MAG: aminopeptidase P family protein [Erysipelotrichales bacterium]|nr:aminopeptidase P family protein [Erysipelotrichales bacterium]